jgi:hypothetical protein
MVNYLIILISVVFNYLIGVWVDYLIELVEYGFELVELVIE